MLGPPKTKAAKPHQLHIATAATIKHPQPKQVAQALPLRAGCAGLGVLLALAQRLEDAVAADAALSKAAAGLLERLSALEADSAPAPSDADLEDVIEKLRGAALSMEPALPGAAADGGGASAAPGTARKGRATRAASLALSGSTPEVAGGSVQSALGAASSLAASTPPPPWVARRRGGTSVPRSPSAPLSPAGSGDDAEARGPEPGEAGARQPLAPSLSANTPASRAAPATKGATPAARRASSRSSVLE
jgi:hypothetical protein